MKKASKNVEKAAKKRYRRISAMSKDWQKVMYSRKLDPLEIEKALAIIRLKEGGLRGDPEL